MAPPSDIEALGAASGFAIAAIRLSRLRLAWSGACDLDGGAGRVRKLQSELGSLIVATIPSQIGTAS